MKVFRTLLLLALLAIHNPARASGPDDDYVSIYNLIQRGDTLSEHGETEFAIAKYVEAQKALNTFQASYPDWNLKIVSYRQRYLSNQIADLSARLKAATGATPPAPTNSTPGQSAAPGAVPSPNAPMIVTPIRSIAPALTPAPQPSEAEVSLQRLQEQLRGLQAENAALQAKLKEAFAAQPAAVAPEELSRAQARVLELQKQNDLLTASLAEAKQNPPPAGGAAAEKIKRDLAEATARAGQLASSNATLQMDKAALQARVDSLSGGGPDILALRSENAVLRKNLADLKANAATAPPAVNNSAALLQEAQTRLAVLESEKEVLKRENNVLENRVKAMSAAPVNLVATNSLNPSPAGDNSEARQMIRLESERAELQKSLDAATRDLAGRKKGKILAARIDALSAEVAELKARIGVLESSNIPYTSEELDLLNQPPTVLAGASAHRPKKSHREFTPAQALLIKEGQQFFLEKKYDQAEQKYEAVLAMDPTNVVTLADLASVQLEAGRLAEADQNLIDALAIDPEDDYTLYVMGQVKFLEKDYDASLNALSRASEITPQNAKIRNFIGLALDEKGLRTEAETAFRRAIQLDPEFAEAHMNLAVVYATQKPPLLELAKWHYQKAMLIGHAPNPALEKLLDGHASDSPGATH